MTAKQDLVRTLGAAVIDGIFYSRPTGFADVQEMDNWLVLLFVHIVLGPERFVVYITAGINIIRDCIRSSRYLCGPGYRLQDTDRDFL